LQILFAEELEGNFLIGYLSGLVQARLKLPQAL
jgi:hypothetical protein